jgi:pyruvate kinase
MDVARLNFSHGTHADHAEVIRRIREGEPRWGKPIAILQDLQGPKLRLGSFKGGSVKLETGSSFVLTTEPALGDVGRAAVSHPEALGAVKPGDQVWIDDGIVQLVVESVEKGKIHCRVTAGGIVSDHKGVSLPRVPVPLSCLTPKDLEDLSFGIHHGVDYVAISFVRSAADIQEVRRALDEAGARLPVVAKLERSEAVANLASVLASVDAVMVARGDLGMDVPLEEVPLIQKEVIRQARGAKVPVIVATQMLESMVEHLRPTRAEVSDVATAIFDGADAIMLSAETATGAHPVETVELMARIAERAEGSLPRSRAEPNRRAEGYGFPEAVADAACHAARSLKARAIVAFTQSGFTARLMSADRPEVPIIALTPSEQVMRRLSLFWGVSSRLIGKAATTDEMIEEVEATLLGDGSVRPNDVLVIVSGAPMWVAGTTNLMKLHRVGERR